MKILILSLSILTMSSGAFAKYVLLEKGGGCAPFHDNGNGTGTALSGTSVDASGNRWCHYGSIRIKAKGQPTQVTGPKKP